MFYYKIRINFDLRPR